MSLWTYVNGSICIDTYSESAIDDVREFLKIAPKITGSERNVDIFINQPSGYNVTRSYYENEEFISKEYETRVILTLFGNLRDRDLERTKKELHTFLTKLSKNFEIEQYSVKVTD